jgi:hypothetical protein
MPSEAAPTLNGKTERERARLVAATAIRSGALIRQPCEVCGTTRKVQAHHEDYGRPLEITWLCQQHHSQRHKELGDWWRQKLWPEKTSDTFEAGTFQRIADLSVPGERRVDFIREAVRRELERREAVPHAVEKRPDTGQMSDQNATQLGSDADSDRAAGDGEPTTLMTAEGRDAFLAQRKADLASVMANVPLRRHDQSDELRRIARLAMKLPAPWIGGATGKPRISWEEWREAFDEIERIANG